MLGRTKLGWGGHRLWKWKVPVASRKRYILGKKIFGDKECKIKLFTFVTPVKSKLNLSFPQRYFLPYFSRYFRPYSVPLYYRKFFTPHEVKKKIGVRRKLAVGVSYKIEGNFIWKSPPPSGTVLRSGGKRMIGFFDEGGRRKRTHKAKTSKIAFTNTIQNFL